jgi:hypothetical protein
MPILNKIPYPVNLSIINPLSELLTSRGRSKGEVVAPEDVVNYLEGATTKALE